MNERAAAVERAKAKAESDAREAVAREESRKAMADAAAARAAKEKAERDLAEQQQAEAHRKAQEALVAKKAAAAPDRQKLTTFAIQVRSMRPVALSDSAEAKALLVRIDDQCQKFAAWIEVEAGKL